MIDVKHNSAKVSPVPNTPALRWNAITFLSRSPRVSSREQTRKKNGGVLKFSSLMTRRRRLVANFMFSIRKSLEGGRIVRWFQIMRKFNWLC